MKKYLKIYLFFLKQKYDINDYILFSIRLEKEYTVIRKEEQEEQVEIRVCTFYFALYRSWHSFIFQRLRNENRILKQRVENLEKVC